MASRKRTAPTDSIHDVTNEVMKAQFVIVTYPDLLFLYMVVTLFEGIHEHAQRQSLSTDHHHSSHVDKSNTNQSKK
jgi:hypothetical protein